MDNRRDLFGDPRLVVPQCSSLIPVEIVHENPWFSVQNRKGYFTIEYKQPQVLILPIVDNKSVVMVRVFRPIIADSTLELPAGGSINNETPAETAVRELAEETGIEIHDFNRFEVLAPLVYTVRSPVHAHFFKVHLTGREFDMRKAHDHEIESVECFSFRDTLRKIADGEIYITTPIAIIARYFIQNQVINEVTS